MGDPVVGYFDNQIWGLSEKKKIKKRKKNYGTWNKVKPKTLVYTNQHQMDVLTSLVLLSCFYVALKSSTTG